ncbi:MAG: hypothetical protein PXX77_01515 [Gallionella sp.]|nr:hypothetical protein [Gallionella sp.]
MKVTAQVNQVSPIEFSQSSLRLLIGFLEDEPVNHAFFDELALHPSSQIRAEVAGKLNLSAATFERLSVDPSIEVVKTISTNSTAWEVLPAEVFKTMIRRDVSVALEMLAWSLGEMRPDLREVVLAEILKYDDPAILDAVQNEK